MFWLPCFRPDDGRRVEKGPPGKRVHLDNRFVVPYNPYLCQKYNAHINVEICVTIKSVKYIYKYVFKGHDCAQVQVTSEVCS